MSDTNQTRGVRNNNPGNIRIGVPWDGRKLPNTDGSFDQFTTPQYGIRALMKLLLAYQDYHGLKTVAQIINRWAPTNENDTSAYVHSVATSLDVQPNDCIDLHKRVTLIDLAAAIIKVECAGYAYPLSVMYDASAMAQPETV
jgi:hypothetical protein